MKPADFTAARIVADKLMSSCNPSEHWDALEELTQDQKLALDQIALEFATCNHWFPTPDKECV